MIRAARMTNRRDYGPIRVSSPSILSDSQIEERFRKNLREAKRMKKMSIRNNLLEEAAMYEREISYYKERLA